MIVPALKIVVVMGTVLTGIPVVSGHGRLTNPPSRSYMWRDGYKTPVNNQDNELNCGGLYRQKVNNYRCGVCGDPFDGVRENERGGKYATGIITRKYTQGQNVTMTFEITANQKGYIEMRLCATNSTTSKETEECFNSNLLIINGNGTRYFISDKIGFFDISVTLPSGVTCSNCVLQWRYHAGNNWGVDENGASIRCGRQEEYYNCADVSISNSGAPGTTTTRSPTIKECMTTPTTSETTTTTTTSKTATTLAAQSTTTATAHTTTTPPAPNTTTKAAPNTTTRAAPNTTTRAAPNTTTRAAPNTTTRAAPNTTTRAAPNTTTRTAPNTTTRAAPNTTTRAAPITTTRAAPNTTTRATPITTTRAAPNTTTRAAPNTTTRAAPITTTRAAPITTTRAAPNTTTRAAPNTTTRAAPNTTTRAAPNTTTRAAPNTTTRAAPNTTTLTPIITTTISTPPSVTAINGDMIICRGVVKTLNLDAYCQINCQMGNCPASHCVCVKGQYPHTSTRPVGCRAAGGFANLPGYDTWCLNNCNLGYCPSYLCVC